ncbi:hypothetical protein, partial [Streptomyces goshikiensis]|uniref:hypothetical protein n=1 Tax=Streptomyces goshikiensis TaxID=1942 RepID=UPI00367BD43C
RSISTAGTWRSRPGVVGWKTACSRRIPSFSILEDVDEDVLAEAAAEARAFGAGPAAAVDELVRGLLGLGRLAAVDRRAGPRAHHGN